MTGKCCRGNKGILSRVLDRGRMMVVVAYELRKFLPMFTWMTVVFLPGCATPGVIEVKNLQPEYIAAPARVVKTLALTKLARPTESQSVLQPGDVLEVTCANLFEETSAERKLAETFPVRVSPTGKVTLPLLSNELDVGAMTVSEAEHTMRSAYRNAQLLKQPQLTLKVLDYKKNKISVIGAVKKPGIYQLRPDHSDPLRAIAAAEGVTEDAGTIVEIRRTVRTDSPRPAAPITKNEGTPGAVAFEPAQDGDANPGAPDAGIEPVGFADPDGQNKTARSAVPAHQEGSEAHEKVARFDLTNLDVNYRPDQLALQNGDIVSVEQKKIKPFFVTGSVNKTGEFPMPLGRDIRVLEAIGMAGGVLIASEPTNALLSRRPEGKAPIVVHIDLNRAARYPQENLSLMEGDVITVVEDAASQTRRMVRQLARFGIYPTR